jgi:MATE family multidrug resistance protein
MKSTEFQNTSFWKTFKNDLISTLKLSYPIVIGQIGIVLMGVADTVMVGELGADDLAAAGISNSIFFVISIIGIGVMSLVSPLIATAKSQNNSHECSLILSNAFQIAVWLGLAVSLVIVIFSFNFEIFGQKPEVAKLAVSYFIIIGVSSLPMFVFMSLKNFTDGLTFTKPAMYITFLGLGNNVLWNWILIHGKFGFPTLGLDGAGYATLFTRILMAILMYLFILNSRRLKSFLPDFSLFKYNSLISNKIWRLGLPAGLQYFFEVGAFGGAAMMIGWLGTYQLAAHQVAINLASVTYMIAAGFAAAGSIRVGDAKGEGSKSKTLRYGTSAMFLAILFMGIACLAFVIFNQSLVGLYQVKEQEVFDIAVSLLIIAGFFQLSDGIQVVALGALRGLEDVNIPTAITMVAYWVIGIPLSYVFGFILKWDVQGVWIALSLALTFSAICLTTRFYILANRSSYYLNFKKEEVLN